MLFDMIFMPNLEYSSYLPPLRMHCRFYILEFLPTYVIIGPEMWAEAPFFYNVNFDDFIVIRVKNCFRKGVKLGVF